MTNPVSGPGYLIRGFKLINQPGIRAFAILPILLASLVFALLVWLGFGYFGDLLEWILPSGDSWWVTLIRGVLWPLFFIAVVLLLYFSFTVLANLIAAPFNGLLAEKVEALLTGQAPQQPTGVKALIADILPSMINELRKLGYYLIWALPLLILFLIPMVNLIAPLLWALFVAWMHAFEYAEYPMENHHIRFKQVRQTLKSKRLLGLSFGASVMVAMLIPVVNLLVMPAAVAGATAMWVEQYKQKQ
ncbi:MAG: sulfate transporter CysZ [Gammaproteobacteria bacterium]|nr:sulfate transporter CysZ [Gammaproteobacteria bacterium]